MNFRFLFSILFFLTPYLVFSFVWKAQIGEEEMCFSSSIIKSVKTTPARDFYIDLKDGTQILIAKNDFKGFHCDVTNQIIGLDSMKFELHNFDIFEGDTLQLIPSFTPSVSSIQDLIWTSSDKNVASISSKGLVIAQGKGEAIIKAKSTYDLSIQDSCLIKVYPNLNNFDYYLEAKDIETSIDKANLNISIHNISPILGLQFDIDLPSNIEIERTPSEEYAIELTDELSNTHIMTSADVEDKVRVMIYSLSNIAFDTINGSLIKIPIKVKEKEYRQKIEFSNIIMSLEENIKQPCPQTFCNVYSVDYIKGDINNDGDFTMIDVTLLTDYIMGVCHEDFVWKAADLDQDGDINIVDLTKEIALVLNNTSLKNIDKAIYQPNLCSSYFAPSFDNNSNNTLHLDFNIDEGAIAAQFDLSYIGETSIESVELASLKSNHLLDYKIIDENSSRILVFSPTNQTLSSDLTIDILFTDNEVVKDLKLENIKIDNRSDNGHISEINLADIQLILEDPDIYQPFVDGTLKITMDNLTIFIESEKDCEIIISNIKGVSQVKRITKGINTFVMPEPGIYLINNQKLYVH